MSTAGRAAVGAVRVLDVSFDLDDFLPKQEQNGNVDDFFFVLDFVSIGCLSTAGTSLEGAAGTSSSKEGGA